VSALFEIADKLDVKSDEGRGMYDLTHNGLRIHRLLNVLVRDRVDQAARIPMLRTAMQSASLYWYCDFAERCQRDHQPDQHGRRTPDDQQYVDKKTADEFIKEALKRIRKAAKGGTLEQQRRLVSMLYEWVRLSPRGMKEVRPKAVKLLGNDEFVKHLGLDTFRIGWSHSMGFGGTGDLVAKGTAQVNKEAVRELVDEKEFLRRVRELLASATDPAEITFWKTYIETWERPAEEHM
jgi:hypothetical protein